MDLFPQAQPSVDLLYELGRELTATLDLSTLLQRVLMISTTRIGAERGSIMALDEGGDVVEAALIYEGQMRPFTPKETEDVMRSGLAGWTMHHKQAVLIVDTSHDERWLQRPDDQPSHSGPKSAMAVPLVVDGTVMGCLTLVHPKVAFFTEAHLRLLQVIADFASIAIRNARLYQSLQAARQRYYHLFSDAIVPILVTDGQGLILEANRRAAEISGYEVDELHGRPIESLWAAGAGQKPVPPVGGEEGGTSFESELSSKDGHNLPVAVFANRIRLEDKDAIQWMLEDVSQQKDLAQLREDLTATVYHDLRTPLANIRAGVDLLRASLPEEALRTVSTILQVITRSIDRMERLIAELLDVNRLEAGKPIAEMRQTDPLALLSDAVEAVRYVIEANGQQLRVEVSADQIPMLWGDDDMLKRTLINLMENASKFSPTGGTIRVGLENKGDALRYWVQDSGAGIPEEERSRLFQKYARLETSPAARGYGLGLAFCRLAVEAHGGTIGVEGEEGKGSTFFFYLPIGQHPAETQKSEEAV